MAQVAGTALPNAAAAHMDQVAETLALLHQAAFESKPLSFLTRQEDAISSKLAQRTRQEQLDETLNEGATRSPISATPGWNRPSNKR